MNYYGYKIILKYSNDIFLQNLHNIIENKPIVNDKITRIFIYITDLLNHQLYTKDIARFLMECCENNCTQIHTNQQINIINNNNIPFKIRKVDNNYPFLVVKNQNRTINFSVSHMVKNLVNTIGDKWKI